MAENEKVLGTKAIFPTQYFTAGIISLVFGALGIFLAIWIISLPSQLEGMGFPYSVIGALPVFKKITVIMGTMVLGINAILTAGGIVSVMRKNLGRIIVFIGACADLIMKIILISIYTSKIMPLVREAMTLLPKSKDIWLLKMPGVIAISVILAVVPITLIILAIYPKREKTTLCK